MQSNHRYTRYAKSQGFSFIEMLIALAVFSVILLALNQTEFQSSQSITQDYFQEIAFVLMHNAYEKAYVVNGEKNIPEAAEKLPQGEGTIFSSSEHINIEISWSNRFSEQRNQLHVDI